MSIPPNQRAFNTVFQKCSFRWGYDSVDLMCLVNCIPTPTQGPVNVVSGVRKIGRGSEPQWSKTGRMEMSQRFTVEEVVSGIDPGVVENGPIGRDTELKKSG